MRPALLALLALNLVALSSGAFALTFTPIDVPGASATAAWGINAAGRIVGLYVDNDGAEHGFLLDKGTFTTIDVPGASATAAFGINAAGRIVGAYDDMSGAEHGFLLDKEGTFTPIDVPGATFTAAIGINAAGRIDDDESAHEIPQETHARGHDGEREFDEQHSGHREREFEIAVVGVYDDNSGAEHGFLLDKGTFTPIDVPGALFTAAIGINAAGRIDDDESAHEIPQETHARGQDGERRQLEQHIAHRERECEIAVVGFYVDGGGVHGFVAQ
jgi:uncharacterized membrane protein